MNALAPSVQNLMERLLVGMKCSLAVMKPQAESILIAVVPW